MVSLVRKGRGAASNRDSRFLDAQTEACDDGWGEEAPVRLVTSVTVEHPRSVVTRNRSPDVPFEQSVNPYRGCEHGCVYCYARPTHAYLGLSPGQDFESRLFAKVDADRVLEAELSRPGYRCQPLVLGTNTDPYQPVERGQRITRRGAGGVVQGASSGIENRPFYADNTRMLYGDGREAITNLIQELKIL